MKAAQLTVDSVGRERMQTLDGHQVMSGVARLVGTTHDAAILGAQLGRQVLVVPAPSATPTTLPERLLRVTTLVLELGLEIDGIHMHDLDQGRDRLRIDLAQLEQIIDGDDEYMVAALGSDDLAEVSIERRGVQLYAIARGHDAERWLRLFDGPEQAPAGGVQ